MECTPDELACDLIANYQSPLTSTSRRREISGEIIQLYSQWISSVIASMRPPRWIDKEELFADVMPDVLSAIDKYDSQQGKLTTLLFTVVKRAATKSIKSTMRYSRHYGDYESLVESTSDTNLLEVDEAAFAIHVAMASQNLTREYRLVLDRLILGTPRSEICQQLGIHPSKVATIISRIQDMLATSISQDSGISNDNIIPRTIADRATKRLQSKLGSTATNRKLS